MPTYTDTDGKPFTVPAVPADAKIVSVLAKYFGRKPGQSLTEFGGEVKALTNADKEQMLAGFCNGTLTY
jgi:hypothetical protein